MQQLLNFESELIQKKVRPVIKWTGGKYAEFQMFSQHIPSFEKYFEPFFGGGGVFFALQPQKQAFLNDKSSDLITFYRLMQSSDMKEELLKYCHIWDDAETLASLLGPQILPVFEVFINNEIHLSELKSAIEKIVQNVAIVQNFFLFKSSFIENPDKLIKRLNASITDKCKRIKAICEKKRSFDKSEMHDHIQTGIKSGLYFFIRDCMNLQYAGKLKMSEAKASATWYFVREFCYASMFRYNRKGEFNIPYGGIAYNKKNFRTKVENIFLEDTQQLFKNAKFYNLDFADFILQMKPQKNDFIFLDPPYDSEFSEYDQNLFTKDDQVRLRDVLAQTEAKWMLVIKETEFIRSLYSLAQCRFIEFDKTYTYNVKGRNNRETKHLIIVNYNS